jgi:hypothetical protein
LHITNEKLEIPSISIQGYLDSKNTWITNNTKKILVFNDCFDLVGIVKKNEKNSDVSKNYMILPKIFDGSVFLDSNQTIEDEYSEYYKKLMKYYKLKNRFKNNNIYDFSNSSKLRHTKNIKNLKTIKNKIPLYFENEKFTEKISNLLPKIKVTNKHDNYLGLWPYSMPMPMPLPNIPENDDINILLSKRKNRSHNRLKSNQSILRGFRSLLNETYNMKIKPGLFLNKKIDDLKNNDQTIRVLSNVE